MDDATPISTPAGYVTAFTLGYSDERGDLALVRQARPLPVSLRPADALPEPLAGSLPASGSAGPFVPAPGQPVMLSLSGDWRGSVTLQRSVDGGTTRLPLTLAGRPWARFTANACEPVWTETEAGVSLFLVAEIAGGTLEYRIAQ